MKVKMREFFAKLNNSYVIAAICIILIGVILLGAMIGLVARPYVIGMKYSVKYHPSFFSSYNERIAELVLLEGGRYSMTISYTLSKGVTTTFGDYGYGRVPLESQDSRLHNILILENGEYGQAVSVQKNPFKITTDYFGEEVTLTCVGGIVLLVVYCILIVLCAAIATILLVKRKNGKIVFSDRLGIFRKFM